MKLRNLQDVVEFDLCAGCGLCAALDEKGSTYMAFNEHGFLRPVFGADSQHNWAEWRTICPGAYVEEPYWDDVRRTNLWGSIKSAHVGFASDERIRWQASSGGVLTAILTWLVSTGTVDAVIQVGASETHPFVTSTHINQTVKRIVASAGSRYAPTAPLAVLPQLLSDKNSKYAFVGKPCDASALRRLLDRDSEFAQRIPVIVSFFCAGVSSQHATYELVRQLGLELDEVCKLRYRGHGWPGAFVVADKSGRERSMSYARSWGETLNRRLQFRCKVCPDGIGELADIVCADAWETKDGYPDFTERPGLSLVLSRTEVGERVLQGCRADGFLTLRPYDLVRLQDMQPYQRDRRRGILPRLMAMRFVGYPVPTFKGFALLRNALQAGPVFFLRQFLGMLRRLRGR